MSMNNGKSGIMIDSSHRVGVRSEPARRLWYRAVETGPQYALHPREPRLRGTSSAHANSCRTQRLMVSASPGGVAVDWQLPAVVGAAGRNGAPRSSPRPMVWTSVHGCGVEVYRMPRALGVAWLSWEG